MKAQYITPAVTIFDAAGKVDAAGNCRLYDHLIEGGIDGIVIMGSTGEFSFMTVDEIKRLIDVFLEHCKGRIKTYVGVSRMIAEETIALGNYAMQKGANGVMIISPYYFQLTDDSLYDYFHQVAEGIKGPIFLYNFPEITGHGLKPEVVLKLAQNHENIVGIKDTTALFPHTRDLINLVLPVRPDFQIFNGYDEYFGIVAMSGGAGVIGGLSNLIPEVFARWVKAVNEGDFAAACACQQKVNSAMKLYQIGAPYIPIMKRALNLRGLSLSETVQPPLLPCTKEQETQLVALMKELELL